MRRRAPLLAAFAASALAGLSGCAANQWRRSTDPAEHACALRNDQLPTTDLVATADPEEAPFLQVGNAPYTVTLLPGEEGFVAVRLAEPSELLLLLSIDRILGSLRWDGLSLEAPDAEPDPYCPDLLPALYTLTLEPGDWAFGLGPVPTDDVWLQLNDAASADPE